MSALEQMQALLDAATQPTEVIPPVSRELDPRLHGYQRRAVQHLWDNPRAGLFLEMGLGKTATVLQALTPDHLPALVVAPKRVAEHVWSTEVAKWRPDLSVAVAAGTPAKRRTAFDQAADITVIGRDNLGDVQPGHRFRTLVIDELSGYKSHTSKRFKHARKLTGSCRAVWGLTGTPSPNGYMDLFSQIALLDDGQRLGRRITHFREQYFSVGKRHPYNGVVIRWDIKHGAREQIQQKISDICLSMKSADYLELPATTINTIEVPLPAGTQRVYDRMLTDLVADLRDRGGLAHTARDAATATTKLSQITAGFLYPDKIDQPADPAILDSAKLDAVVEVVEGSGSPVLVFYRYREELARLAAALPGARKVDEPGVLEAWNRGEVPVLLAHPASAGHGLNLQAGGHTIVWSTMPWSLEEWDQSIARLARQGQTFPVMVHCLVVPGSIDESILARLKARGSVQSALMDALGLTDSKPV